MSETDRTILAIIDFVLIIQAAMLGHFSGKALVILARRLKNRVTSRNHHKREEPDDTYLRQPGSDTTEPEERGVRTVRV